MLRRSALALTAAALTTLLTTPALAAAGPAPVLSPPTHPAATAQTTAQTTGAGGTAATRQVDHAPCDRLLLPNHTYRAHTASYRTDAHGRPERAEASHLTASVADRGSCQGKVGHMAPRAGYDGGHLIAATLYGVDERYDLVPQWYSVNRGIYLRMESGAKSCLKEPGGRILHYRITVTYPDAATVVPDKFLTDVRVDTAGHSARTVDLAIPNRPLGTDEKQRLRDHLNTDLEAAGCN